MAPIQKKDKVLVFVRQETRGKQGRSGPPCTQGRAAS